MKKGWYVIGPPIQNSSTIPGNWKLKVYFSSSFSNNSWVAAILLLNKTKTHLSLKKIKPTLLLCNVVGGGRQKYIFLKLFKTGLADHWQVEVQNAHRSFCVQKLSVRVPWRKHLHKANDIRLRPRIPCSCVSIGLLFLSRLITDRTHYTDRIRILGRFR